MYEINSKMGYQWEEGGILFNFMQSIEYRITGKTGN